MNKLQTAKCTELTDFINRRFSQNGIAQFITVSKWGGSEYIIEIKNCYDKHSTVMGFFKAQKAVDFLHAFYAGMIFGK